MYWFDPILLPLARLAVRKGWLFPAVAQRLKQAYLKAAVSLGGGQVSDSKISIVTGLQRRDISRLRAETDPTPHQRQPLAEIIARWWHDPAYDPLGIPTLGEGASFATLARSVRQDVHPRTFLDILIDTGAVTENGQTVMLKSRTFRPLADSDDQLAYLADNVGDHLAVAVSNVVDAQERYDMAVHYRGLSSSAIKQLDRHFRTRMSETLQELDTMVRTLPSGNSGAHRFRAGGYFFEGRADDSETGEGSNDP